MSINNLKKETYDEDEFWSPTSPKSNRSSSSSDYRNKLASLERIVFALRQKNVIHEERLNNITNELKELKEENSFHRENAYTLSDTKIYVGNIDRKTSLNDLEDHFSKYGDVIDAFFFREFHNCRNAFIIFQEPTAARKALDDSHNLHNRNLTIGRAREKLRLRKDNKENNNRNFKSKQNDSKSRRYRPY